MTDGHALTVELETPDGPMPVVELVPHGRARGAVIVLHEVFGLDDHALLVGRRLCAEGYHVVVPNLFHRVGGGTAPHDDFRAARRLVSHLDDDAFLRDIDALLEHLGGRGFERARTGVVGYSLGGRFAFLLATCRPLAAAVTYSGPAIVTAEVPDRFPALVDRPLVVPWLGLFGGRDRVVPRADVARLEDAARRATASSGVVCYELGGHGFHQSSRRSHDPASSDDAWRRTLAWLASHMDAEAPA